LAAFAVILAASSVTHLARAFPSSRLIYVRGKGTEQCPGEEIVRSEVSSRLGYDPFFLWAERTIVAQVTGDGRQYRATVQLLDERGVVRGSRALSSPSDDCTQLIKAIALAISISIDPESVTQSGPKIAATDDSGRSSPVEQASDVPPTEPRLGAAVASPPTKEEAIDASVPRAAPKIEPEIGVGIWSAVNLAPDVSVGGTIFGGARWGPAALYFELRQNLQASGDGIAAALLTGAVVPCGRYDILFACLNASWGELRVEGARSARATYMAVGGRLGVQVSVFRQLSLRFHLEGLKSLTETIVMRGDQQAWQLPAVSAALGTDASLRF
jgi:hypothetical protein